MGFLSAETFLALMDARRKQEREEALTATEQALLSKHPEPPVLPCGCGCGQPMRHASEQYTIGGKFVRPDCWYKAFGEEIEKYPIISPTLRVRTRGRGR